LACETPVIAFDCSSGPQWFSIKKMDCWLPIKM
jgi:hypothetical protein